VTRFFRLTFKGPKAGAFGIGPTWYAVTQAARARFGLTYFVDAKEIDESEMPRIKKGKRKGDVIAAIDLRETSS
jgi:hypothetical protein